VTSRPWPAVPISTVDNTQVTEVALAATSHVSTLEALLVARSPHTEDRLRQIADAGVAGMANVVMGVERRL
jgi:hypothetical protein